MLTIGVVSLYGHYNYGNRLQSMAVCKLVEDRGHKPVVIDCLPKPSSLAKRMVKGVFGIGVDPTRSMSDTRRARFYGFDESVEVMHVPISLLRSDLCDCWIVGSDQIWNPDIIRPRLAFLEFAEKHQRIALAPSIGASTIPDKLSGVYRDGLLGFPVLSVRENDAAKIVMEISGRRATVLSDPVFGLTARRWTELSSDDLTPDGPYVLAYSLGEVDERVEEEILSIAKAVSGRIIRLSDKSRPGEVDAGPAEFISLIANASYVITDSFHCAAFSVILNVPFSVFRRTERTSTFSRVSSLMATYSLGRRTIGEDDYKRHIGIPPIANQELLDAERGKINRYLDAELNRVWKASGSPISTSNG